MDADWESLKENIDILALQHLSFLWLLLLFHINGVNLRNGI